MNIEEIRIDLIRLQAYLNDLKLEPHCDYEKDKCINQTLSFIDKQNNSIDSLKNCKNCGNFNNKYGYDCCKLAETLCSRWCESEPGAIDAWIPID